MSKIVLCIENGNPHFEETKKFLSLHDCKIYTLSEKQNIRTLLEKIEQKEGKLDILLLGVDERMPQDGAIGEKHDYRAILETVSGQINRTQDVIEASLPLLRKGELKRIGMIIRKDSSISHCKDDRNYGQHMVWAGLNMVGKLYFNLLRPEGFTFRWYCAGEKSGGMSSGEYLLSGLCYDAGEPYLHSDENRFVMRDAYLQETAW